ncbi:MAG: family NAD(P)-dependent oxidoreductase [Pseudomonadota bacterium]|nr:family NAD(P)-dependent oxidoreductase [Pseudomonadota bacterium]
MLSSLPAGSNVLIQGASRGIGLEFVRQLLAEPQVGRIFAACRSPQTATVLTSLASGDPRLRALALDVSDEESIRAAAAAVLSATPRLHLVINCAGILHDAASGIAPEKRLADVRPESLIASFAVNAFGPLLVAKHFEGLLAHKERAVFASISARVGSIGDNRLGGWYAYRGAKAAQNMFTKTLSIEWARSRRNVICIALHPGTTDTDLSRPFQANVAPEKLFSSERTVRQLLAVIDGLQPEDTGRFLGWDGAEIPW